MYYFAASTGWVFDIHTSLQVHNRPSYLILCTYTTLINNAHRVRQQVDVQMQKYISMYGQALYL